MASVREALVQADKLGSRRVSPGPGKGRRKLESVRSPEGMQCQNTLCGRTQLRGRQNLGPALGQQREEIERASHADSVDPTGTLAPPQSGNTLDGTSPPERDLSVVPEKTEHVPRSGLL